MATLEFEFFEVADVSQEARFRSENKQADSKKATKMVKCGNVFIENGVVLIVCGACRHKYYRFRHFKEHLLESHSQEYSLTHETDNGQEQRLFAQDSSNAGKIDCEGNVEKLEFRRITESVKMIPNTQLKCEICEEKFPTREHLLDHNEVHRHAKAIIDRGTEMTNQTLLTKSESGQKDGKAAKTNSKIECVCRYCDQLFSSEESLARHESEHDNDPKRYECEICEEKFRTRKLLFDHIEVHRVATDPKAIGGKDIEMTSQTTVLVLDSETESENLPKRFECDFCGKNFTKKKFLDKHINKHSKQTFFECTKCDARFNKRYSFNAHIKRHEGDKPHTCPECGTGFHDKSNLVTHIRRIHKKEKRYECEFCGKRFVCNIERKIHLRSHTGEKPYQCSCCGKCFTTSSHLNEHSKRHTNTKPFKCNLCEKSFYSKKLLKNHNVCHTKEKPFKCETCGAEFPRQASLRFHKKLHSSVKEYACKICGKEFAQYAGLYGHMKQHGIVTSSHSNNTVE